MENRIENDALWNRNYISILLANIFISVSFFTLNPTFPVYIKSLVNNLGLVGLLSSVFLISATLIRPISGHLTDVLNKKKIFLFGLFLLCISILGYIFIKSIPGIIIARVLHGIGMGLSTTAFGALASENIPDSRMGEGMGYYGLSMVLGMSIGPSIGLSLMNSMGAQVAFGFAGIFSAIGAVILIAVYRDQAKIVTHHPHPVTAGKVQFFNIEKTALVPASLIFFIGIVVSSITTYLALYATERGILNIGFFYTIQSVAVLLSRSINGRLADRKGYAIVILPSIASLLAAMVLLFFATTPVIFMVTAFLYGFGYGTLTSACQALSVVKARPERRGLAISTYYLGMDAGNGTGMIVNGMISSALGYATMYLLCTIPLVVSLVIFGVWGRVPPRV